VIGVLKNPGLGASLSWIKETSSPVELDKNILHDVLGFTSVPENSQTDTQHKAKVSVKKERHGIAMTCLETRNKIFIAQPAQLGRCQGHSESFRTTERQLLACHAARTSLTSPEHAHLLGNRTFRLRMNAARDTLDQPSELETSVSVTSMAVECQAQFAKKSRERAQEN